MNGKVSHSARTRQGGFTLIEIMMVVAAIGVLMALLIPNMTGGGSKQSAQLMERVARTANTNYTMINRTCGTSMRIASNKLLGSDKDSTGVENLLFYGTLNSDYEGCYVRAGTSPQTADIDSTDNDLLLTGTDITVSFGDEDVTSPAGARSFNVVFSNVSRDIAESVAKRYNSDLTASDVISSPGNIPSEAGDRAPLHIDGSNDDLTVTYRFLW